MTISLEVVQLKLVRRLKHLDRGFERQLLAPKLDHLMDRFALQEGYVSALWQAWCSFCRELLVGSSLGARTAGGTVTTSPHSARHEMEIAFIAKQLSKQRNITTITQLQGSHQEHTWGALDKLNLVVPNIGCSNSSTISSAMSVCLRIADLQICRNASAHITKTSFQLIQTSKVRYMDTKLMHPSDMMYWVDPSTDDFLWKSWIEEMELASSFAIV